MNHPTDVVPLLDNRGYRIDFVTAPDVIGLYGWKLSTEPGEQYATVLQLTPETAIELARRLLNAAAAIG